jgi:hypothetical protein
MTRLALIVLPCLITATSLAAQTDDSRAGAVEMKIQRPLTSDTNGVPDTLDNVVTDRLVLNYVLQNVGRTDIQLGQVEIVDVVNCKVQITMMPERQVVAGGSTLMVIEATPGTEGPLSFVVNMNVDGQPYSIPVQTTVTAVLHGSDHHCHWWGCHSHHTHDHGHCSTGAGTSWLGLAALAAALAVVGVRRRPF